jgi:hypothetical protein
MNRLRAIRRLSWRERALVLQLAALAPLVELAVRFVSLPRLGRIAGVRLLEDARAEMRPVGGPAHEEAERRAVLIDRFYRRWPLKGSCLRRSLVLGYKVRDLDPILKIGVAREDRQVRAHAWIEVAGLSVGREDGEYAPLRSSSDQL